MTVVAVVWGLFVAVLSFFCWGGQVVAYFAPDAGVRFGLADDPSEVEPAFLADARGEALWDVFTLWTLVVAGVLLAAGQEAWAYFALFGGGTYVYFAGRGVAARLAMRRRGLRIGNPGSVRVALIALSIWGVMAGITAIAAVVALIESGT